MKTRLFQLDAQRRLRRGLTPLAVAAAALCALPAPAADYVWGSGSLSAQSFAGGINLNDTLAIVPGGGKYVDLDFSSTASVSATDSLYFQYASQVWRNGWTFDLQGDVGLVNVYAGGLFVNEATGTLVKSAGSGSSTISITFVARGGSVLSAASGSINFSAGGASFDSGARLLASAGAAIVFSGGNAGFAEGVRFEGSGRYEFGTASSFAGNVGAADWAFTGGSFTGGDGSAGSSATLTSNAQWSGSAALQGSWNLAAGRTLWANGSGSRYVRGTLLNEGTLSTDASFYFEYASHALHNRGQLELAGDGGLINAYAGGTLNNSGTLAKTAGSGTSWISGINVANSGRIDVQTGTLRFDGGSLAFADGSRFTGAGTAVVSSGANFAGRIHSQNLVLAGASYNGGDGSHAAAELHGSTRWTGGALTGQWTLAADHHLQVEGGSKYIRGSVLNLGSLATTDPLYFEYTSHMLDNRGSLALQGDVGFVSTYAGGTVLNSGTLAKTAGTGTATVSGISFHSAAGSLLDVQTGSLSVVGGDSAFAAGATLRAAPGTTVEFAAGQAHFADGVALEGAGRFVLGGNTTVLGALAAQQLNLASGNFTGGDGSAGSGARLDSDASWTGNGALLGSWRIGAGRTLAAQGDGARYVRGVVDNQGTLRSERDLYFEYASHRIDNAGRLELQGDVGLVTTYAGGTLNNTGTLAKTAGNGISWISGVSMTNSGRIEVASGTLQFSGGSHQFNHGSRFTGAGTALVSSSANFAGRIDSENLVLAGASYNGGDGATHLTAEMHGSTRWTGGSLSGDWTLAADHTLHIEAGSAHHLRGTVLNLGRIDSTETLYFEYPSHVLDNRGTLRLQGDVGLVTTYVGGTLLNSGRLIKTAGSGTADLSSINVVNTGTLQVDAGTLRLPANFVNGGTLTGTGQLATNLLVNQGHIAPGASPGTLAVDGSVVLDSSGSLDIELLDMAQHDQLRVSGSLTLGGTLALQCHAVCAYTAGSDILILDADGSLSGSFDSVTLAGFASGDFSVVVDTAQANVWLHVNQDVTAAVPEPEGWALMLSGLAVLGLLARRRASGPA